MVLPTYGLQLKNTINIFSTFTACFIRSIIYNFKDPMEARIKQFTYSPLIRHLSTFKVSPIAF